MAKKQTQTVVRYCRDCAYAVEDTKFENLSLEGKPTLLACPFKEWKIIINTTETCENYKLKSL